MDLGLKDKVALVAASSSGLGKAVALGLAREGCHLVLCSRDQKRIEQAAEEIHLETGVEVVAQAIDVSVEADVQKLVNTAIFRFGQIDICVTNAGGPPSKTFDQTTMVDWENAVQMNLMSTLYFAQAVLPGMRERQWGRFITITSTSVKQPIDGLILSNSVRSAVAGLVKTLSNEYGRDHVLIHNVCPGYTATDRLMSLATRLADQEQISVEEIVDRWAQSSALKRIGTPEEFANVVVFLASERASYLTGSSISVDGGAVKGIFS